MDYKDTLLLPNTAFAMRGNLPDAEPKSFVKLQRDWLQYLHADGQNVRPDFVLHDGPPYANGHLHVGHALNKILKDIIIKSKFFHEGKRVHYTPGWDCHGLPIEQQAQKKIEAAGRDIKDASVAEIHAECAAWADEFINIQREEFRAMGVNANWQKPYLTKQPHFEANIYKTLLSVAKKGLLKERFKPVYWSWAARSALAEAEVEYEDKEDYSIFVAFALGAEAKQRLAAAGASAAALENARAVIWTTTPWTLPANKAIAMAASERYVLLDNGLIVAAARKQHCEFAANAQVVCEFGGDLLERAEAINPLNGAASVFITGEHVAMDGGSGLVHTAPGHGEDDYYACLRYDIAVEMPVDDEGKYDENILRLVPSAPDLLGMHVFKANERVIELLGSAALSVSKFVHSYPFCWRTHKPIIYRATSQFFIAMDEPCLGDAAARQTLRQVALRAIEAVKFYPANGINRLRTMIENRPDWCISRQRCWGVPIAFLRDGAGQLVRDWELYEHFASLFEAHGIGIWWEWPLEKLLPQNRREEAARYSKVTDILDVWFDSGSTFNCVLASGEFGLSQPQADMYLEGSDQHRGWFQSSLLLSCALNEQAPYRAVLTHGFSVDERGRKMSKSLGNVIAPSQIASEYGMEIFRLYIATADFSSDLKLGMNTLKQSGELYRKLRNTLRFLLAATDDLDAQSFEFSELDRMILARAQGVFSTFSAAFADYDFARAMSALAAFMSSDLSGVYLDVCKDVLYCEAANSPRRRATQTACALLLNRILRLLAPVLTHTCDEALRAASKVVSGGAESIFALKELGWPELAASADFAALLRSREAVNEKIDVLKKEKRIKSSAELRLLSTDAALLAYEGAAEFLGLASVATIAPSESPVSAATDALADFSASSGARYVLLAATAHKCPRCWRHLAEQPEALCARCAEVMA